MKTILLAIFCYSCFWFCNANGRKSPEKIEGFSSRMGDTVSYQTQIQPILQEKCSPCHFSGGKMYERMPFDKGETIISHQAGILKRIKDEKEAALIREYVQKQPKYWNCSVNKSISNAMDGFYHHGRIRRQVFS